MPKNSSEQKDSVDFRHKIPEYSDEVLKSILKKRNLYQKEAADLAIKEALKREIIYSEQDLFGEEYKVKELKFSVFPEISNEAIKNKIRKSIARTIFIAGVIPLIWGIVQINNKELLNGGILLFMGILWMFSAAQLIRFYHQKIVVLLYFLVFISVLYVVRLFFLVKNATVMDFFVPLIMCGLILYGLTFLYKLYKG